MLLSIPGCKLLKSTTWLKELTKTLQLRSHADMGFGKSKKLEVVFWMTSFVLFITIAFRLIACKKTRKHGIGKHVHSSCQKLA